jgi:hypothetical protein
MTSLVATLAAYFSGRAKGIPTNANAQSPLVAAVNVSLSSTGTGATKANEAVGPEDRTLAASANESLDLSSYTNTLGETAKAVTKVRAVQIEHLSTSLASGIVVGNGTNPFGGLLTTNTATFTLAPGQGVIMYSPTTAGMTVDGTHKTIKVLNSDAVNAATYRRTVLGEV